MKKLIRWYYKEYFVFLFATVATAIAAFAGEFQSWTSLFYEDITFYTELLQTNDYDILRYCLGVDLDEVSYYVVTRYYLDMLFVVLLGSIFAQRVFYYLSISNDSGRCYFASMPFHKADYGKWYILRDITTIVVTIFSVTVYAYFEMEKYLGTIGVQIPWLLQSLTGLAVLTCCYMLFLLGVYVLLESLFTNGFVKVAGAMGIISVVYMLLEKIESIFSQNAIVTAVYDFINMGDTAGNNLRSAVGQMGYRYKTIVHKLEETPYLFKGEQISYPGATMLESEESIGGMGLIGSFCRFYDFSIVETVLVDSLLYLLFAVVLIVLTIWLTGRWEESKAIFYHEGTKYAIGAFLGITMFLMYYQEGMALGKTLLGGFFGVGTFVMFIVIFQLKNIQMRDKKLDIKK